MALLHQWNWLIGWLNQNFNGVNLATYIVHRASSSYIWYEWPLEDIGVGNRGCGRRALAPSQIREKKYFSGKRHVIFGLLMYFWKKEKQAPFIFWQHSVFHFMCTWNIALNFETRFSSTFYWFFIMHFPAKISCLSKLTERLRLCLRIFLIGAKLRKGGEATRRMIRGSNCPTWFQGHPWDMCKSDTKFWITLPSTESASTKLLIAVKCTKIYRFQRQISKVSRRQAPDPYRGGA